MDKVLGDKIRFSGYSLMALSMFLYSLCEALEKYLTNTYDPAQIIFFRSSIALIFAAWITHNKGVSAYKNDKGLHLLRNVFASGALLLTIYSLKYLPLSSYGFMALWLYGFYIAYFYFHIFLYLLKRKPYKISCFSNYSQFLWNPYHDLSFCRYGS